MPSEVAVRTIPASLPAAGLAPGVATTDRIARVKLSLALLPLKAPVSDAKVLTGRQKPLTEVAMLFAEIESENGHHGIGFSYSKRAGGYGLFAHAEEIAGNLIGEDPNDIARLWDKLVWAGASVGRSGLSTQAIAAFDIALWDMKAKRADLPLAKLLGARRDAVRCYNTSGGFLSTPTEQLIDNCAASLESGIGGIKIKVGQPDPMIDLARLEAVREAIGDGVPL
ncbi:MAG TPA: enolase, partial [Devosiaceae bacterium]|nr:enolase [Devosiaceae bacterium]